MSYVEINGDALRELFESPEGEVARDLQRRALQVDRMAKNLCPVGTPESTGKKGYRGGRLRSSITNEIGQDGEGLVAVVGTNVEYAPYVELGTSKMAAQPFLLPALEAAQ
jgi:HK97 gp10 family phage protein